MKDYKIAGHRISINFEDPTTNENLLPSFAPFICEEEEAPLILINVVDEYSWDNDAKEIGLFDVGGSIFSISQFTLYADARKGNRPGFTAALGGPQAVELYDYFNECLREEGLKVETGIFGAMMSISLTNEGPITIILDNL